MSELTYLTTEDVLYLIRRLGVGPVRDLGLIDAALARPRASAYGTDAYPTLALKAAAMLQSLVRNHALIDGNKPLAWLATAVFADLNDRPIGLTDDEAFQLVMDAADGSAAVEEIARRFVID
ncbi:MAG: Fic family protein [Actinobacteria bacterium]|nr:Fic family protein [Actinomycetota bacterium]